MCGPQRVVEPQASAQHDAVARGDDGNEHRAGAGGSQRQQRHRLQVGGGNGALEDVQRIERQRQLQQAREAGKRERRAQRAAHLGQQLPRRGHRDTTDNRPPQLRGGSHRDFVTGA